jgi:hypothetical protein
LVIINDLELNLRPLVKTPFRGRDDKVYLFLVPASYFKDGFPVELVPTMEPNKNIK